MKTKKNIIHSLPKLHNLLFIFKIYEIESLVFILGYKILFLAIKRIAFSLLNAHLNENILNVRVLMWVKYF